MSDIETLVSNNIYGDLGQLDNKSYYHDDKDRVHEKSSIEKVLYWLGYVRKHLYLIIHIKKIFSAVYEKTLKFQIESTDLRSFSFGAYPIFFVVLT